MTSIRTAKSITAAVLIASAAPALADHGSAGNGPQSSGPIIGLSAGTLGVERAAVSLDLAILKPDSRGDAGLLALAARHVPAHDLDHVAIYTISGAYGLTDDLTLSASLPFVQRAAIREAVHSHVGGIATGMIEARGQSAGIGDAAIAAKWRFTGENHHGWEAALLAGIKMPTGATRRLDKGGERFETEHQPGTGSWDPFFGLAASRPLGGGNVNFGATYQISGKGSQHTRLGNRARLDLGLTRRLVGSMADHSDPDHDPSDHAHASLDGIFELNGEWEGRLHEDGALDRYTGGKALFVSPGLRLGLGGWSLALAGSVPLAQDIRKSHAPARYRLRIGIGKAL